MHHNNNPEDLYRILVDSMVTVDGCFIDLHMEQYGALSLSLPAAAKQITDRDFDN